MFSVLTLTMASLVRGRALTLLDALAAQASVSASRNISSLNASGGGQKNGLGTVARVSEAKNSAASATHKPCGRVPGSYRRLSSGGQPKRQLQQPGRQISPPAPPHPAALAEDDLRHMFDDIQKELESQFDLHEIAKYYFDGKGKAVRPLITVLMSRAINSHLHNDYRLLESQRQVAMMGEMIHTASLLHDDVLDASDTRRGKPSVNYLYGQRKAVMAGDFILSVAFNKIARHCNADAILAVAQIPKDLIHGEFLQLDTKENEDERFAQYLKKSFLKTAALMALNCKAVVILSGGDEELQEVAFQYGRNVGIAFQLVDDMLDFVGISSTLGKPTAADLKLGMATAPVLFAAGKFPELNPMIMRRFQEPGDVERAFDLVHQSDGLEQTQFLARQHCQEAIRVISTLKPSDEQKALVTITDKVLNRIK